MFKNFLFITFLIFSSCSSSLFNNHKKEKKIDTSNSTPDWILNPLKYSNGKKVAVGCAEVHYRGFSVQKKLAIQRAIDELAMQVNTTINNITYRNKKISGRFKKSSLQSKSIQSVNNVNIKSTILKEYKYPNGRYCVLVIQD